jgi:hypothetical protein
MKKNVAGQFIGTEMIALDGSAFTGTVTVYITGNNGTQTIGSVGSGACVHKGNGYHSYAPAQAETNYDHAAFTFTGSGAVPVTINVYPGFPQSGDSFARLGAPAGASISADLSSMRGATFNSADDSLEAIRNRGDAAWITGGGGGITQMLNVQPVIPSSIDLANTATVRLGMILLNALDDLPSTAEITPGTISIERKAYGGTSWSAVVTDAAMSEQAGMVYYDEVFDAGTGYALNDSLRITFKSVSITADANTFEVVGASGIMFQTSIRQQYPLIFDQLKISGDGEVRIDEYSALLSRDLVEDPDGMLKAVSDAVSDIGSRTVASLVSGRVPVTVEAINNDASAAVNLKNHAKRAVPVTFSAGGTTTAAVLATVDGSPPNSSNDYIYKNAALVFSAPAALKDQRALIQSYNASTGVVTITQVASPVGADAVAVLT